MLFNTYARTAHKILLGNAPPWLSCWEKNLRLDRPSCPARFAHDNRGLPFLLEVGVGAAAFLAQHARVYVKTYFLVHRLVGEPSLQHQALAFHLAWNREFSEQPLGEAGWLAPQALANGVKVFDERLVALNEDFRDRKLEPLSRRTRFLGYGESRVQQFLVRIQFLVSTPCFYLM